MAVRASPAAEPARRASSSGRNRLTSPELGVERPDERDDEQRPERRRSRKAHAGRGHQACRQGEHATQRMAPGEDANQDCRERRADQRGAANESDVQLAESESEQVRRQKHRDESITEAAQSPTDEQGQRARVRTGRQNQA
jgi:hypothetical protein